VLLLRLVLLVTSGGSYARREHADERGGGGAEGRDLGLGSVAAVQAQRLVAVEAHDRKWVLGSYVHTGFVRARCRLD
jgi:hypothetical protein